MIFTWFLVLVCWVVVIIKKDRAFKKRMEQIDKVLVGASYTSPIRIQYGGGDSITLHEVQPDGKLKLIAGPGSNSEIRIQEIIYDNPGKKVRITGTSNNQISYFVE